MTKRRSGQGRDGSDSVGRISDFNFLLSAMRESDFNFLLSAMREYDLSQSLCREWYSGVFAKSLPWVRFRIHSVGGISIDSHLPPRRDLFYLPLLDPSRPVWLRRNFQAESSSDNGLKRHFVVAIFLDAIILTILDWLPLIALFVQHTP